VKKKEKSMSSTNEATGKEENGVSRVCFAVTWGIEKKQYCERRGIGRGAEKKNTRQPDGRGHESAL